MESDQITQTTPQPTSISRAAPQGAIGAGLVSSTGSHVTAALYKLVAGLEERCDGCRILAKRRGGGDDLPFARTRTRSLRRVERQQKMDRGRQWVPGVAGRGHRGEPRKDPIWWRSGCAVTDMGRRKPCHSTGGTDTLRGSAISVPIELSR